MVIDRTEHEMIPGVVVERRAFLTLPALAALALAGDWPSPARAEETPPPATAPLRATTLDWEGFLTGSTAAVQPTWKQEGFHEEAYLHTLSAWASRLGAIPDTPLNPYAAVNPRAHFGISHRGSPYFVVQWRLEPGAVLPAHCHPETAVCTVGIEGEARLRNFRIEGEAPAYDSGSQKTFRIRETKNEIMAPGRINTLSRTRDNIHHFEASAEGARGIDITTGFGGDGSFSFLHFDPDSPLDPKRRTFEAVWTGSDNKL